MTVSLDYHDRCCGALWGMFIGDALAMPVHWYYDTEALERDYGWVIDYSAPKNPHPDSILWRSSYTPQRLSPDILHDQARYWGQRGIHYHQFLRAGENTLNAKLARELLTLCQKADYQPLSWLKRLVNFMTTPGSHRDTYVEEYLRHFFDNMGRGEPLTQCARQDEKHIGGLTLMLPLVVTMSADPALARRTALSHLALTHGGAKMAEAGALVIDLLLALLDGNPLHEALTEICTANSTPLTDHAFTELFTYPDRTVVGRHWSTACYVESAIPATLYLSLKYANDPEAGLIANTNCGGDNAGRGAVLGALLGAAHGTAAWPERWRRGLLEPPPVISPGDMKHET